MGEVAVFADWRAFRSPASYASSAEILLAEALIGYRAEKRATQSLAAGG
jgi:hypothetical protein